MDLQVIPNGRMFIFFFNFTYTACKRYKNNYADSLLGHMPQQTLSGINQ
jgi:hypothetical protein